jgi:hypothetical protein
MHLAHGDGLCSSHRDRPLMRSDASLMDSGQKERSVLRRTPRRRRSQNVDGSARMDQNQNQNQSPKAKLARVSQAPEPMAPEAWVSEAQLPEDEMVQFGSPSA